MSSDFATARSSTVLEPAPRRPMIVADDAHVTYRVYASGKKMAPRERLLSAQLLRGGRGLKTVPALRGVTFTASEGESIGVVGHNGSGKSTLFRAMSGLIPTSEGTIWARDRPVLLGVNAALVPSLSGENNIKLGLLAMGFTPEEAAARVGEIADFAELNEFIHHPMKTYSSGMGARLRFAIASAKAHSTLLIDEALAVGDRRFRLKSEKRIAELRETAGLVMIVSHSIGSLRDTTERSLWIHKGELRADGPSADVIAEYVKWTKDPTSVSVGAASTSAAKKPTAAAPVAVAAASATQHAAPTRARKPAAEQSEVSLFEELLHGLEPETPNDAAEETKRSIPASSDRTSRRAARREQYRDAAKKRSRRRVIAGAITGVAIVAAVGAGAAFAWLANGTADTVASGSKQAVLEQVSKQQPVIVSFNAGIAPISCASEDAQASAKFSWEVVGASYVAVTPTPSAEAVGARPKTLKPEATDYELPYPCAAETQKYTLTAESSDGTTVTKLVTVSRAAIPTPTPTPTTPEAEVPDPPSTNPVRPVAPPPATSPSQPPAAPAPQPTSAPQPSLPPVLPTIPAPAPEPTPEPPPATEEPPPTEESGGDAPAPTT